MPVVAFFKYKNHRGEVADRRVRVETIGWIEEPGFGYEPGWFISGHCLDKGDRRSFAFVNIVRPDNGRSAHTGYTLLNL
jgi:hypothetical protein